MAVHTSELAFNALFAIALDQRHPRWDVHAEQTQVLRGDAGKKPDLVVVPQGSVGEPVVIETEYLPANTVERDAASRLGSILDQSGHRIEQVVTVRVPEAMKTLNPNALLSAIAEAEFEYAQIRDTPNGRVRFPKQGWLTGTVDDLAGFCERISLNERLLDEAVDLLERTVDSVAQNLRAALEAHHQTSLHDMAEELHQADDPQTTRMAVAIIASALLFHSAIEGVEQGELTVPMTRTNVHRDRVLDNWDEILKINYYPIFEIASKVLEHIPLDEGNQVIDGLAAMVPELSGLGVTSTSEMAGQMFGRLIADRKFLATFYTRPESAYLLAELAIQRIDCDWTDQAQVEALRVADLACGTGALLTAAYQRIASRIRRGWGTAEGDASGLDDETLHPAMMEKVLIGADIMPAAVHLSATVLSSMHPAVAFGDSPVHLMPYGDEGTGVQIGSLELLDDSFQLPFSYRLPQRITGAGARPSYAVLDHGAADLVIMNPPFTRSTGQEAEKRGVPQPAFAGFNTSTAEQKAMQGRLKQLHRSVLDPASHGNAGLGSDFVDLAHAKVKAGGTIAFVLPFTVVTGAAWQGTRHLLQTHYERLCVVAIADTGSSNRAFSADTDIAEVLIIARRKTEADSIGRVLYVNLHQRPSSLVEAVEIARCLRGVSKRQAAGSIMIGVQNVGNFIWADLDDGGCAGAINEDLAACAVSMRKDEWT